MTENTNKLQLLDNIQTERAFLEHSLESVAKDRMTTPEFDGGWSVKDILAHIVFWEQWAVRIIESVQRGQTPAPPGPNMTDEALNQLNAQVYRENKDRSLDDVMADFRASYPVIKALAESLSDDDLFVKDRSPDLQILFWEVIAYNSSDHYREHADQIREWMQTHN